MNVIQDMVITNPNLKTSHLVTGLSLNKEYIFIVKAKNLGTPYGKSITTTATVLNNGECNQCNNVTITITTSIFASRQLII